LNFQRKKMSCRTIPRRDYARAAGGAWLGAGADGSRQMLGARSPAGRCAERPVLLSARAGSSERPPAAALGAAWTVPSAVALAAAAANDANGSAPAGASPTSTAAHAAAILPRIRASLRPVRALSSAGKARDPEDRDVSGQKRTDPTVPSQPPEEGAWLLAGLRERYAIGRELGRGGMGQVFAARDLRLGREVAIKVLPPGAHSEEQLRRFEQEARAAGSLDHPNVLVVHDIGQCESGPYIVSELLQGATLRQRMDKPLPAATAVDYALQLAQGMQAAHGQGVIHRDLKPENLFITQDGRLKILDFGIAKLIAAEGPRPNTEEGAIFGTISYMSPEQVRGDRADHRSDVFAFGNILYEMLAGRPAFDRASGLETGAAILKDEPPALPAHVPRGLDGIVRRCLEKDPKDRFQSAADLALELSGQRRSPPRRAWWAALGAALLLAGLAVFWRPRPAAVAGTSIAVLPFVNLSSDKDNEFFSDGMTEELINALANVEGLRVASRTSAFSFKGRNLDVARIGNELKVNTVLEGSVRREGNSLRVAAQLIEVANGYHLWSHIYDRELKNVFSLEDELARAIVQALRPKLLPGPAPLVRTATANTAAHDLYLRGRHFAARRTMEGLKKAAELFQQAVELDPAYALAHVGLADSYILRGEYGGERPSDVIPKARLALRRALELDDSAPEAHASFGPVGWYEHDWDLAERELLRALQLRPSFATAHHWYSIQLSVIGRFKESQLEAARARELDPTSLIVNNMVASSYYFARDYDRVIEEEARTLELDPTFSVARNYIVLALVQQKKFPQALAEMEKISDRSSNYEQLRGYAYAMAGNRPAALRILAEMQDRSRREFVSPGALAVIHMALGDKDRAFALLDEAFTVLDWNLREMKVNPMWDPLRSDPRFAHLLKRLRLE
jgi:serine/threonine-protein kinase